MRNHVAPFLRLRNLAFTILLCTAMIAGYQAKVASQEVDCIWEEYEQEDQPCIDYSYYCELCHQMTGQSCTRDSDVFQNVRLYDVRSEGTEWYDSKQVVCFVHHNCVISSHNEKKCVLHMGGISWCAEGTPTEVCIFCHHEDDGLAFMETNVREETCPVEG